MVVMGDGEAAAKMFACRREFLCAAELLARAMDEVSRRIVARHGNHFGFIASSDERAEMLLRSQTRVNRVNSGR
jgi:hypothetical protein